MISVVLHTLPASSSLPWRLRNAVLCTVSYCTYKCIMRGVSTLLRSVCRRARHTCGTPYVNTNLAFPLGVAFVWFFKTRFKYTTMKKKTSCTEFLYNTMLNLCRIFITYLQCLQIYRRLCVFIWDIFWFLFQVRVLFHYIRWQFACGSLMERGNMSLYPAL